MPASKLLGAASNSPAQTFETNERGKLEIGDDWNAIRIIALPQSNPLGAIAEFVENSIDAKAKTISIMRSRKRARIISRSQDDGAAPC